MSSLVATLRSLVPHPRAAVDFDVLRALGGAEVCGLRLFSSLDEAKAEIRSTLPIFMLPIGTYQNETIGVHLRPFDVWSGRTAVIEHSSEAFLGNVEVARSIADLVFLALARAEIGGRPPFHEGVSAVARALGPAFYRPGALGDLDDENVARVVYARRGGWASHFTSELVYAAPDRAIELLEAGVACVPGALVLHAKLASRYLAAGRLLDAAQAMRRALDCYHHTAETYEIPTLYANARQLVAAVPEVFARRHHDEVARCSDKERVQLIGDVVMRGNWAWATKLWCDVGHDTGTYDADPMPIVFRSHFEKLGWDWASQLHAIRRDALKGGALRA